MRRQKFARASIVALAGMVGCGIDALGTAPPDGGASSSSSSSSSSTSSSSSSGSPAPVTDGGEDADANAPLATCKDLPPTWGLVAVVTGADPCPAGFAGGTTELRGGVKTRADTCTCACALTAQPTCIRTAAGADYDNNNSNACDQGSSSTWNPLPNAGCSTDMWPGPYTTSHDWKFSPPMRTGGTCSSNADKHADRLDFDTVARACVPTAGCEGAPAVTAPVQRCVISDGDGACPAGPFTKRRVLGKTFDVLCNATGCGCSITGTCPSGSITFYSNSNCTGSTFAMMATGTCQNCPANNFSVGSYKYIASLSGGGCSVTGASAATASTVTSSTVCCE